MPRILIIALLVLALLAAAALGLMFSGIHDVAASSPHHAVTRWALQTIRKHSVRAQARNVSVPPPADAAALRRGIEHYARTCVACHGAPGVQRGAVGMGLMPAPPDLALAARRWNDLELYWIVKNGIKSTGMPAFGATHPDAELWGIVAFVKRLPAMTPEQYRELAAQASGPVESPPPGPGAAAAAQGAGCKENSECADGQYCDTSPACAPEAAGSCKSRPEVCAQVFAPVTGCDVKLYGNACEAAREGIPSRGKAQP